MGIIFDLKSGHLSLPGKICHGLPNLSGNLDYHSSNDTFILRVENPLEKAI